MLRHLCNVVCVVSYADDTWLTALFEERETGEAGRNLTRIARAGFETRAGDAQDESTYTETVKHLREGMQLLFEQLNPVKPRPHFLASGLH